MYLHGRRHHGPSDRYVLLHKKRYYGYAPGSSTTVINRYHRDGGYAVGGVSGGGARIGSQTTTTTTRSGVNAGARGNGASAANMNRNAVARPARATRAP